MGGNEHQLILVMGMSNKDIDWFTREAFNEYSSMFFDELNAYQKMYPTTDPIPWIVERLRQIANQFDTQYQTVPFFNEGEWLSAMKAFLNGPGMPEQLRDAIKKI